MVSKIDSPTNNERQSLIPSGTTQSEESVVDGHKWKSWSNCTPDEKKVIIMKVALAIFLTSALITASILTGFAATGMLAVIALDASATSFAAVGAVGGAAAGLALGALATPYLAYRFKMHQYHPKKNVKETTKFVLATVGFSAASAGVFAGVGAGAMVAVQFGMNAAINGLNSIKLPSFDPNAFKIAISNSSLLPTLPALPAGLPSIPPSLPAGGL